MPYNLIIHLFIFYSVLYLLNSQNQFYRKQPHDISALIGSNVTIPCVISTPHGDVQWTKDGLALGYDRHLPAFPTWSIIGDENHGEFNFFIQSLKIDDEGIFACEVSPYKEALALKKIAYLRTLVQPKYVQINDRDFSNETKILRIRFDEIIHQIDCQVDGAKPAAHIKWINETGQEFPAASRIFSNTRVFSTISTLTLIPSISLNKKRFICDVHHETLINHTLRTLFEIQITYPPNSPIIYGYSSNKYLINGSYLNLSCQSSGGNPLGRISWYRLENKTQISQENNLSLMITPAENNQTYTCHVQNDYLDSIGQILQANITLKVAFGPSFVNIEGNNMNITTLIEGIPRKFLCRTSSSNPRPIVIWKIDEEILPADINPLEEFGEYHGIKIQSTKTIGLDKSLRNYHKKTLSCQARNPQTDHIIIDSTQLNIIYDSMNIEMHGITKDKIIKSGERVIAECILMGGNPLGKIHWYKGNEYLYSESAIDTNEKYVSSRVEFLVSSFDNNLPLTCQGQVENFPIKIASFILNITFLPEEIMIIEYRNFSINNDNSRLFECRTSKSNPQVQLIITRQSNDGEKHHDIQYKTSNSYINGINSIQFLLPKIDLSFHENLLICEAIIDIDNSPLIKQNTSILYINHKPYFQDFNSSYEIQENQSFNLTLHANAYPLPINYTWFHPQNKQLINNEGQLIFINVQRNDLGIYRCIATNSIGSTEINFTLNVLYEPIITQIQEYSISEALLPGSTAILSCVIDANPIDLNNVRWYKNNQEILFDQWEKRIEEKQVSIIKKSIQRDDVGQYTCEIQNQIGINHANLSLYIQYPPEINRTDPNRNRLAIDSDRFLTAEFHCYLSALPKPTIIWLKDNQTLPFSLKYQAILHEQTSSSFNLQYDAILYVFNVSKLDYGIYQCHVENLLGNDRSEIILTGLTIPDPPTEIQILNISYSSVLISWLPGFNGGNEQKFQIRYSLSKDDRYYYEDIPYGINSYDLKNLKLDHEYHLNIRSNNSYHLSSWSNEIIFKTLNTFPLSFNYLSEYTSIKYSFTIIILIIIFSLIIFLINILLLICFIIKRRKLNINREDLSTTDTNETETNTVDLFQPIPSNFFLTNTFQKYDEERPFVSSISSNNILQSENRSSPYDNVQSYQYYPTYRSFKVNTHQCIQAELV